MPRRVNYLEKFSFDRKFGLKLFKPIRLVLIIPVIAVALLGFLAYVVSPPGDFATGKIFTIDKGQTLGDIADSLKTAHYVRSKVAFEIIVNSIFHGSKKAVAGDYVFDKPLSAFSVAQRIISGDFNLTPIKVTIPEGLNKFEMADLLASRLPDFDKKKFITLAPEGYLFPDTYFFVPNITPEKIIQMMRDDFNEQINPHLADIIKSGRSFSDVITMASIVETEARQSETRQIIASILWKRFDEHMPLQVDVTFKYVNGKTTSDLTLKDLTINSPYNLYKYKGLPPTPIANPGLDSILATISNEKTKYYYFLSDNNGIMHYAVTFAEHVKNKQIYLR